MKTIEDKINEIVEGHAECRWLDAGELQEYLEEVATEQKAIMEAELAEVKRQRDEYYDELLSKREFIAELEAKLAQISETAYEWFQYNAWSFGNYAKGDGSYEWEMAFECFRKTLEE